MDFTLSKQQLLAQKMYREFAENEVKPLAKKVDAEEYFPKETVEKMAKLGMMGIYFPKAVGGVGGDVLSYVLAVEEMSRVCGTTGVVLSAHTSLCAAPIYEMVLPSRRQSICPSFAPVNGWALLALPSPAPAPMRRASRPGPSMKETTGSSTAPRSSSPMQGLRMYSSSSRLPAS